MNTKDSKIIAIHSFRGGTGKSNMAANVGTLLAKEGLRVGVVDTDIQSPGVHLLFGVEDQTQLPNSLNDYLWGNCAIKDAAHDVTSNLNADLEGRVYLIYSSIRVQDINRVIRHGFDVHRLYEGLHNLITDLNLNALLLDTHPGLERETLLSIGMSDVLAIVMRPDRQDYVGTRVTLAVAQGLHVERTVVVINQTPQDWPRNDVQDRVEQTLECEAFDCEVAAVLPHSEEVMKLSSAGIFALHHPEHEVTKLYQQVAERLMA